jgi:hypothetical protein
MTAIPARDRGAIAGAAALNLMMLIAASISWRPDANVARWVGM